MKRAFTTVRGLTALLLLTVTACALVLSPAVQSEAPAVHDPLPIRRVTLTPEKLVSELEKAKRGVLVQLPRVEFDALVRRAAETSAAVKNPPRLVEARYVAKLEDTELEGYAEWKILNPADRAGILPVAPFNLAIQKVHWPENQRAAVLGELEGKDLGLLVDAPGPSSLYMDWSARSIPTGNGLRYSLEMPASAIATLELDLPADRAVVISRDTYLLAGPLPAADAKRRTWRLGFAGRSALTFDVRRVQGPDIPPPLLLSKLQTRQELTPGQLQADVDFEVEVPRGPVTELRCAFTPTLRPYEVAIRNLESWEVRPAGGGKTATLVVKLREPFQGGPLQVRCLAPLLSEKNWTAPGMKLMDAVPRGETLVLRVHPGVVLEEWQPGGFRLTRSIFQPDGWQVLTLAAGVDSGPDPVRPGARIQTPGPEFRVRQQTWWQIDPDKPLLTAQLHYEVAQGRLFSLPLTLPPNWEVDHVEMTPPDLLQHWNVQQDKGKATLLVDLHRPLELNAGARLTIRARPTQSFRVSSSGTAVPIPDIVPVGARLREGALGVSVASLFQASANASLTSTPGDAADETRGRAPWGKTALDFYFPYQGQPVEGALVLRTRTPQVRARCLTDVVVASGRALAMNRLELSPEIGNPQTLDFLISGPPVEWEWKIVRGNNGVQRFERYPDAAPALAVLAARTPLGALALLNLPRPGALWRLTLTQPLREPITLEAAVELTDLDVSGGPALSLLPLATARPLGVAALVAAGPALADQAARQRRWDVPLVTVPAAERFSGQVTLHLGGADLVQVLSTGLREIVDAPRPDGPRGAPAGGRPLAVNVSSSWRTFRYAHPPVALSLRGSMPQADRSGEAVADHASLTSTLGPDGRLLHQYRVQVHQWQQPTLPIQLPPGVRLEAVRVNGRSLLQLPAGVEVNGLLQHELPVTAGVGPHQIEVIYGTELPSWSLWTTLTAPAPELPLPVVMLRRVWRLPPGVAPLRGGLLLRLPGVDLDGASFSPAESTDWAARQEQQLADAVAQLRKQRSDDWPLGTVLERLAIDQRKDRPLVVDSLALQAAGIRRSTALGAKAWEGAGAATLLAGPWEAAGLVHIGCRPAPLLTTRQQLAAWKTAPGMVVASRSLEDAVAEAAAEGHDRSGRFRTIIDWLQLPDAVEGGSDGNGPVALPGLESGVTEWEPLAGADAGAPLTVVRQDMVPVVGLVLAVLVCIAALRFAPQTERKRRRVILIWLAATGLVLLWLPAGLRPLLWGPVLGGLGVAVLWLVRPLRVIAGAPSTILRAPGAPVAASGLVLLMAALLPGQAALAPTVYLLPDGGQPDKQLVLAPPQLLNQLQALERRGVSGLRQAVLLSAVYKGRLEGAAAHLEATFQLHSFADDAVVTLPLTNIQLTEAHLDGAPAHLGKNYALRVTGKGPHVVALRFTTAVVGVGDERELRCGIPELPYSRLTLRVPTAGGYLYAVEARGAQTTTVDGGNLRLAADLGAVKQLAARWHREEPQQPAVSVREAYYWNLQASAARLLAVWQYTMIRGWQQNFELDVPPELDVQSVEARNPPDGPAAPLLLEWSLRGPANGVRRLKLEFQLPVTQAVQVTLEFVPRQPFGNKVNLPFPTPIDARQGQGFLAYRTDGVEAQVTQTLAIAGDKKEVLARAFADWLAGPWRKAREEDLAEPTQSFWRTKGGVLQLSLGAAPQGRCWQEVAWKVGQRQATVRAAAKLTGADLSLVQWEIPGPLAVVEVSGQHVHHWTRSGGRIQVWLQRPVTETTLQLIGWLPRPPQEQSQFNLPPLRILDMEKQSTTVRVAAGDGLVLQPGKVSNLTLRADPTAAGREWTYDADQDGYRATFQTSPATASVDFKLLTFAEAQDREMRFTAQLHGTIRRGELRHLTVALRNWDGGDVTLDAPDVLRKTEKSLGGSGRAWVLELKPGVNRQYSLTLSGKIALGAAPAVFLPDVRVETPESGPMRLERWLAVAGPELAAEAPVGLVEADPLKVLGPWPREAERVRRAGGLLWHVTADEWRLRLRTRLPPARSAAVQLFLTENAALVGDGQRWLHQTTWWLHHEAGADLSLLLPEHAQLLGVAIDNVGVPPLQPSADRLWLPLPGGAAVRTVRLSWVYADGMESLAAPILTGPRLEGVADGPAVWVVGVPTGYEAAGYGAEAARPTSAAGLDLARAAAQLRIAQFLLNRDNGNQALAVQLIAAQDRFERLTRRAEHQLPASPADVTGPGGQRLPVWLQELRDQDSAVTRAPGFAPARVEASKAGVDAAQLWQVNRLPWRISPLEQGRPAYWQAAAALPAPQVHLIPDTAARNRQAVIHSVLLLVLLAASWVLWRYFRAVAWPEQLAVLGGVGLLLFSGPWGLPFLLLPALWLGVRLYHLGRWGRYWLQTAQAGQSLQAAVPTSP